MTTNIDTDQVWASRSLTGRSLPGRRVTKSPNRGVQLLTLREASERLESANENFAFPIMSQHAAIFKQLERLPNRASQDDVLC